MLWKRTIVMLALLAVFTGLAFLSVVSTYSGGAPQLSMPTIQKDAVTKIELLNGAEPATLEKQDSKWSVDGYPADEKQVDRALDLLAGMTFGGMVSENPQSVADYEVGDSAFTVAVHSAAGPAWRLIIGKKTADGSGNFVRQPGENRVFISHRQLDNTLNKARNRWRDSRIVEFDKAQAKEMSIRTPSRALRFIKEGEEWRFAETPPDLPADYRLDGKKIDTMISSMSGLRANDFEDGEPNLAELELAPPAFEASVILNEGEPITLLIGKEKEKALYAKMADKTQVYLIASYIRDNLDKSLADLRDLRLISFDIEQANQMEIREGERFLKFAKTQDLWRLTEASTPPAGDFALDPQKVVGFVKRVSGFQGTECLGREVPQDAGLTEPRGTVAVTLNDGTVKTIAVGAMKGEKEAYLAGDDGLVFVANENTTKSLLRELDSFKVSQSKPQTITPEMMDNLPPEVRQQMMQQERQRIMREQMLRQAMKQQEMQQGQTTQK